MNIIGLQVDKNFKIIENMVLPKSFKKYFWDCNFDEITLDKYVFFIAERILRYGNMDSVNWLLNKIDEEFLKLVIKKSRNLDNKTKNYWESILR